jgi:hypothetical protein
MMKGIHIHFGSVCVLRMKAVLVWEGFRKTLSWSILRYGSVAEYTHGN